MQVAFRENCRIVLRFVTSSALSSLLVKLSTHLCDQRRSIHMACVSGRAHVASCVCVRVCMSAYGSSLFLLSSISLFLPFPLTFSYTLKHLKVYWRSTYCAGNTCLSAANRMCFFTNPAIVPNLGRRRKVAVNGVHSLKHSLQPCALYSSLVPGQLI